MVYTKLNKILLAYINVIWWKEMSASEMSRSLLLFLLIFFPSNFHFVICEIDLMEKIAHRSYMYDADKRKLLK